MYGDVLLLNGQPEAYDTVPHQTLAMLRHFGGNSSFAWIVKTDDDVFLRADALRRVLVGTAELFPKGARIYTGWLVNGAKAHRNGKWAVSVEEYPDEYYPEYASGPTYALTTALARRIVKLHNTSVQASVKPADGARKAKGKPSRPWLHLEDVAMGLWVAAVEAQVRVHRRDDRRFYKGRFCEPWTISVLLERGRPLLFQDGDVRAAMLQLLENEQNAMPDNTSHSNDDAGAAVSDGVPAIRCPRGTRLEDAQERIACQSRQADPDDVLTCAPWLAVVQARTAARNPSPWKGLDAKLLSNLFPGGPPSLQAS